MDIPTPGRRAQAVRAPAELQSPNFTQAQLAWLKKKFPVRVFQPDATPAAMHHYFGQLHVITSIEGQMRAHAAGN